MNDEPQHDPTPHGLTPAQFWHYYQRYPYLLAKAALWAGVFFAIYWLLRNVEAVMFPVLVSLLIAYLLDPAVDWLESLCDRIAFLKRRDVSRTMAIFMFLFVILASMTGFALILYPALAAQVSKVIARFPEIVALFQTSFYPWLERTLAQVGYDIPSDVAAAMEKYGQQIKDALPGVAKKVSQWAGTVLTQTGAVVASILNLVMIPLFTFYFLRDFDRMTHQMSEFVPRARHAYYTERIERMDDVVGEWFRGQVTVALILAALYAVGFGVVFGVTGIGTGTGIAIGILAGVLNIIPYFGVLIGSVLAILMVILDWSGPWPLIAIFGVIVLIQILEGYLITPKIVGEKVGLSPVTVIIVLLLGGELFGLLGVLLAIPVAGILRVLLPDMVEIYKASPFFSGRYGPGSRPPGVDEESGERTATLEEPTDGTLDDHDEPEQEPEVEPSADAKRPVTASHARVTDREDAPPVPMDEGTDGDPEDDTPPVLVDASEEE